jgi:iron complex transport system ATP-binding protein
METRLSVRNLAFTYTRRMEDAVFRDVGFSVQRGEVFCILGPNGTGKSTLLKCLMNLLRPQAGSIEMDGVSLSTLGVSRIARQVAYVPQTQVSAFPFTILEIVVMGRAPHLSLLQSPSSKDLKIALAAMDGIGIGHLADRSCNSVSGGEWQLTLIARALAQEPEILLLDEPTSHLDIANQMKILHVVKTLAEKGLTILMASHFPDHALLVSTVAAILNRGRLVYHGPADAVITEENLREAYGVNVKILYVGKGVDRKVCLFPSLQNTWSPLAGGGG